MRLSKTVARKVARKISTLQKEVEHLARDLASARRDQRNPLSHVYPSQNVGCNNLPASLVRQLESAQDDLRILNEVRLGTLKLAKQKMLKNYLPRFQKEMEKMQALFCNMRATLACIERAKVLLR